MLQRIIIEDLSVSTGCLVVFLVDDNAQKNNKFKATIPTQLIFQTPFISSGFQNGTSRVHCWTKENYRFPLSFFTAYRKNETRSLYLP